MSSQNKTIIIVTLGAFVFFIYLLTLSKTPSIDKEAVDVKIASQLIDKGKIMKGVTKLKAVIERDENNVDAIWQLGKLSMQSSQYDKAIVRFEKFITLAEGDDKASGLIYLADAYFLIGNIEKSLNALVLAKSTTKNEKILIKIDERIKIINKK
jgi:tetratricopeptide (TPR) repeat protein